MTAYSKIVSSKSITLLNMETGETTRISSDHARFNEALALLKEGNYEAVAAITTKGALKRMAEKSADLVDGPLRIEFDGQTVSVSYNNGSEFEPLNNALTDRIIRMAEDGFSIAPMMKFLRNLLKNPSKTAVDELYLFLEATNLPITDDGEFIAYKIVRRDYTSHHDRKFMNQPGTVVEMPRNKVDESRHNTCSYGLHFCSKEYLRSYGCTSDNSDRLVLVKINPADVVTIPSDYNNAKGRACKYLIWKDITEDNWRDKYFGQDYNRASVECGFDEDEEFEEVEEDHSYNYHDKPEEEYHVCWHCGSEDTDFVETESRYSSNYDKYHCNTCGLNFYERAFND
jgi:hypothetical protein